MMSMSDSSKAGLGLGVLALSGFVLYNLRRRCQRKTSVPAKQAEGKQADRTGKQAGKQAGKQTSKQPKPVQVARKPLRKQVRQTPLGSPQANDKSGYYFFSSTPADEAQAFKPKKLGTSARVDVKKAPAAQASRSAWNTGGTWEQRDFSVWGKQRLKALVEQVNVANLTLTCQTVSGECSVVFVRGKRKVGYEHEITGGYVYTHHGTPQQGTFTWTIDNTAGDESDFVCGSRPATDAAAAVTQDILATFIAELSRM